MLNHFVVVYDLIDQHGPGTTHTSMAYGTLGALVAGVGEGDCSIEGLCEGMVWKMLTKNIRRGSIIHMVVETVPICLVVVVAEVGRKRIDDSSPVPPNKCILLNCDYG